MAHDTDRGLNLPQAYVSYPDIALGAAAAAVQVLLANPNRISAMIQNNGSNPLRVGDASISNTQSTLLAAGAITNLDVTSAIFAFSELGSTINAAEIVLS